ncbi:hypothetical protein GCK32_006014, partial [Trichostrongylus colubriformis]
SSSVKPVPPSPFFFNLVHPQKDDQVPKTDLKSLATEENILADPVIQQKLLNSNERAEQGNKQRGDQHTKYPIRTAATMGATPTRGTAEECRDVDGGVNPQKIDRTPQSAETAVRNPVRRVQDRKKASTNECIPVVEQSTQALHDVAEQNKWAKISSAETLPNGKPIEVASRTQYSAEDSRKVPPKQTRFHSSASLQEENHIMWLPPRMNGHQQKRPQMVTEGSAFMVH